MLNIFSDLHVSQENNNFPSGNLMKKPHVSSNCEANASLVKQSALNIVGETEEGQYFHPKSAGSLIGGGQKEINQENNFNIVRPNPYQFLYLI